MPQHWSPDGVRQERTAWRDQSISQRHREWGFNCPAVDLDFLVVEYNLGKPVGVIEYKHHQARMPDHKHATYRALTELADAGGLPFLLVFYWPEIWAFRTHPGNKQAQKMFTRGELLTERQYVSRLYEMRQLVLDAHLEERLNNKLPQSEAA